MEPSELRALQPRPPEDAADMAVVQQANLVQLKVAESKRGGFDSALHDLRVPAPGTVRRFREALIAREVIAAYDDLSLRLRTHEIWGQFCLLCWFFHVEDPQRPPTFAGLPEETLIRCPAAVAVKTLELEKSLWRLRFEQRFRSDPDFKNDPRFEAACEAALEIPLLVMGQNVRVCSNDTLLLGACEFAGMLATARWLGDDRWDWGQPGIMDLPSEPSGGGV